MRLSSALCYTAVFSSNMQRMRLLVSYASRLNIVTRYDNLSKTILQDTLQLGWAMPWSAEEMLNGQH